MLDFVNKTVAKIFGNKSGRDIKKLQPEVAHINEYYDTLKDLSHDELREKTTIFKARIAEFLKEIDDEVAALKEETETNEELEASEKDEIYKRIDTLTAKRDEELEVVLNELLPEAFAVVKETARRFKENEKMEVAATQLDRDLAARPNRDHIIINGDKAVFINRWKAAGNEIIWDMVHYDVQLVGGIVLHQGKIAEMATGEGKTLVSTLPAYLNALSGQGVHLVTVNDYLARRDCEWNAPIFEFLGITVDCIEYHRPNSEARRKAYQAGITYGTNNEFGFDYLRDNMARDPEDMVQRKPHYAMVDEVDSVLIDDARTPLIISGPSKGSDEDQKRFYELKPRVERLLKAQRDLLSKVLADAKVKYKEGDEKEAGFLLLRAYRGLPKNKALIKFLSEHGVKALLQKTENFYMQDQSKEMHKVDEVLYFVIDEKNNSIELAEKGTDLITAQGEDPEFFILPDVGTYLADIEKADVPDEEKIHRKDELMRDFAIKSERIHTINQLVKAYTLFENDVEYILADNKIKIVDEQTGRVMEGRRYSDGLHQAIEAKENVKVEASTQTFATVTLQNYFRMYHKLCGMTGTAETEAGEFWQIYKLDVVVIPTNRPIVRDDREDLVFKTVREKFNGVIEEIQELVNQGRPILVGTTSVEISELLSRMMKMRGIKHNVLNAKQHQREAEIVAEAGKAGNVTIATNMAGRGTDIKLREGVKEAGGLAIIGTERHESRRVDRQLRGRAGRQGDPGSSQFYVSLEDNLMRLFGSARIAKFMDRLGLKEGEEIQHSMITKSIERAQRKVEENNFGIRKRLLEYDDVMNSQREVIYKRRRHALYGERLSVDLDNMLTDLCEELVITYQATADFQGFNLELMRLLAVQSPFTETEFVEKDAREISEKLHLFLQREYKHKNDVIVETALPVLKKVHQTRGETVENIVVPFSDGTRYLQVVANLKKALETNGKSLIRAFEKMATLAMIDEAWKEHLRELDDLKQSVQAAVYEQKDPLIIYKMESFKLFQEMVTRVNKEVLSMLFLGKLPQPDPDQVREARVRQKADMSQMQTSRAEGVVAAKENGQRENQKAEPVRVADKVGRNDPCPCGSGKKYKHCHGKNA
ncbi:MAG: preprotein translocase subunit SecA [Bacteroidia bacterium]